MLLHKAGLVGQLRIVWLDFSYIPMGSHDLVSHQAPLVAVIMSLQHTLRIAVNCMVLLKMNRNLRHVEKFNSILCEKNSAKKTDISPTSFYSQTLKRTPQVKWVTTKNPVIKTPHLSPLGYTTEAAIRTNPRSNVT